MLLKPAIGGVSGKIKNFKKNKTEGLILQNIQGLQRQRKVKSRGINYSYDSGL